MNTQVAAAGNAMRQMPSTDASKDVIRYIADQERLERTLTRTTYIAVMGVFILPVLIGRDPDVFSVIIGAIFSFFLAKLILRGVRALILKPIRQSRYDRAAARLSSQLQASGDIAVGPYSWTVETPGAIAITSTGDVVILDHAHGYAPLRLALHQIADVRVERQSQVLTQTHHGGRTSLMGLGSSFGAAYTMGGRSTSVTSTIDEYALEIRYQLEKNGPVSTVVVPGGSDRRVVEELCATIRRLEA